MNITPINKNYTAPKNVQTLNFGSRVGVKKDEAKNIFCSEKIVKSTLKEFSNSRGQYLADIDLSDIYIPNTPRKAGKTENSFSYPKMIVQSTPIVFGSAVKCLADQPLADTFELQANKDKNLQIPFGGAYPQYLIDQDGVVEDYECTTNGIQDIANSAYCKPAHFSFKGKEENILQKICRTLKEYLPL